MISKNTCAKIFFQINCLYFLFFFFGRFQKSGFICFYPKILSCVEINLFEFRSQVQIPHVTEVWVNFTTQLGFHQDMDREHFFSHVAENYRLKLVNAF